VSAERRALADLIVRGLAAAGTKVVYGMPGGGNNLEIIGACDRAGLRFILTHGETAAAIMAGVDGELNGLPGACVVTRGPGATSVVNGAAQALLDRQPMVLITDAVPIFERDRVSHQRVDQEALLAPVTKWSVSVGNDDAERVVDTAVRIACTPPQGPVHLAFDPDAPAPPHVSVREALRTANVAAAERLLSASERPVFAIGVGARHAQPAIRELLEGKAWPALTTYKAKGILSERQENAAGLLTGATIEAPVLEEADLIIGLGLDPVEFVSGRWPYPAPVLLFAEWPLVDAYFEGSVEIVGPMTETLRLVAKHLRSPDRPTSARDRRLLSEKTIRVDTRELSPHEVVEATRETAPRGTIATIDAGAHMLVAMPLWEVESSEEVLVSSGLATMGFALPAAIAAAVARPDRHVVCFVGDGGLGMTVAELETVSRLGLPVVVVVFNDSALSLIEIKQAPHDQGGTDAVRYHNSNFGSVAQGFGVQARQVRDLDGLSDALREAFQQRRPYLIDAVVDPSGYSDVLDAVRGNRSVVRA
jgi:acetolactate synthase-1/2/3 large subunit